MDWVSRHSQKEPLAQKGGQSAQVGTVLQAGEGRASAREHAFIMQAISRLSPLLMKSPRTAAGAETTDR